MSQKFKTFIKQNSGAINDLAEIFQAFKIDNQKIEFESARTRIIDWLENFDKIGFKEFKLPLELLQKIEFLTTDQIINDLSELSKEHRKQKNTYIAPLGEVKESSFRITASLNNQENFFPSLSGLLNVIVDPLNSSILLFDDFLNSGGQLVNIFYALLNKDLPNGEINDEIHGRTRLEDSLIKKLLLTNIHIFYYQAFDEGIEKIETRLNEELHLKIKIHRHIPANDNDGAFGTIKEQEKIANGIPGTLNTRGPFLNKKYSDLKLIYNSLKSIGEALLRKNELSWIEPKYKSRALGYNNKCRLIVADYNVPTVSITALWQEAEIRYNGKAIIWKKLFPRTKKILQPLSIAIIDKKEVVEELVEEAQQISGQNNIEVIHEKISSKFIKNAFYFDESNSEELFKLYSEFFKPLISIQKGDFFALHSEKDIFTSLVNFILNSESDNPLLVNGYAGCGKSLFLSLLYLNFYYKLKKEQSTKIPVLINLHHYNKRIYERNDISYFEQAISLLKEDLKPFYGLTKETLSKEVIIIIDGADEYINPKVDLDDFILAEINKLSIRKKVIGLRRHKSDDNAKTLVKSNSISFIENPSFILALTKIKVGTEIYLPFVKALAEIESIASRKDAEELTNYIIEKCNDFRLEEIDLFIANTLLKGFRSPFKYNKAKSLGSFYAEYLGELGVNKIKCAEIAFEVFNRPLEFANKDKNCIEWWTIQRHESLRDYLVAFNIVKKLAEYNPKNKDVFNFVYPYDLNNFCKEIINEDLNLQNKCFESITQLIGSVHLTAKTHFCYLLGRFENPTLKEKAKDFLLSLKGSVFDEVAKKIPFDSTKKLSNDEKRDLLYLRTIYISLTYLGDEKSSSEYIRQLTHNRYFDNLNRGFHLEYYEDIIFDPTSPNTLKHEDNLNGFNKTFSKLFSKLKGAVSQKKIYPMFQIELYTLCSLAQHRQVKGNLEEEKRVLILELIRDKETKGIIQNPKHDLDIYLSFIKKRLSNPERFKTGIFIKELFRLKSIQRRGWELRKINSPETVAAHMYGAFMLAYLHLPSHLADEPEYDKNRILRMILVHDLAEAYIGDLAPHEKTIETNKKEEKHFENLSLVGTYEGISSLSDIIDLYKVFSHNQQHINSKIAREIDKLDCLLQLLLYNDDNSQPRMEDFEIFKQELIDTIETEIGNNIKNLILDLFED